MMRCGHQEAGVSHRKTVVQPRLAGSAVVRERRRGRRVMNTLRKFLATQNKQLDGCKVAVQGFGNVGFHTARLLDERNATIVAISEKSSAIYSEKGIDVAKAGQYYRENGTLEDFPDTESITNEELLTLTCDVLIPAAMENTITAEVAPHIQAKIIVEGANGPTTPEADQVLRDAGVTILPDILANAGGVTVSYFEWVQGLRQLFLGPQRRPG